MLNLQTEFPQVGAVAFLRPDADRPMPEPCRILQHRGDGRISIALTGRPYSASNPDLAQRASGNRTVDLADLAATAEEALPPAKKPAVAANRKRKGRK